MPNAHAAAGKACAPHSPALASAALAPITMDTRSGPAGVAIVEFLVPTLKLILPLVARASVNLTTASPFADAEVQVGGLSALDLFLYACFVPVALGVQPSLGSHPEPFSPAGMGCVR